MIHFLLIAIKEIMEQEFEHVLFPDPLAPDKRIPPHVFIGDLPPKRSRETQGNDFPFILIRAGNARDENVEGLEQSTVNVSLVCGIWAKREEGVDVPESGVTECQNLVDHCRRVLRGNPVLDGKFKLILPLIWHVQEQEKSTISYYIGALDTNWDIPPLSENSVLEGAGYGENES